MVLSGTPYYLKPQLPLIVGGVGAAAVTPGGKGTTVGSATGLLNTQQPGKPERPSQGIKHAQPTTGMIAPTIRNNDDDEDNNSNSARVNA